MITLPSGFLTRLAADATRLTLCGVVHRNDGVDLRSTQFDDDIVVEDGDRAGTYLATQPITPTEVKNASDLSTDSLTVTGAFDDTLVFTGFTREDMKAGLFRDAAFEVFLCFWDDPDLGQKVVRRGYLGESSWNSDGIFNMEWRGLMQGLQQTVGATCGDKCNVRRFGDARCGIDTATLEVTGTVTAVTSRRRFDASLTGVPGGVPITYFDLGEIVFASGDNATKYTRQIRRGAADGATQGKLDLWESMPYDVEVGDTFTLVPGCDRRWETCTGVFNNGVNMRAPGRWMAGPYKIIRWPG